ncbi:MAG TPA: hypothetical protein VFA39_14460 [Steroidobacteraceae bacterium]|nr:hypothetical protein [Steroidobacteraceae bacterium]
MRSPAGFSSPAIRRVREIELGVPPESGFRLERQGVARPGVVNTMRDRAALLGGHGPQQRGLQGPTPPTVGAEHADLLLQELERTLLALPGAAQSTRADAVFAASRRLPGWLTCAETSRVLLAEA